MNRNVDFNKRFENFHCFLNHSIATAALDVIAFATVVLPSQNIIEKVLADL